MKRLELIGNLTEDVKLEKRTVKEKETDLANITLACDGEGKENTSFITVAVWGKDAVNLAKYKKKGSKLYIECDVVNNNYERDGKKVYGYNFNAVKVTYLDAAAK